jgi:hypothetical protein
MKYSFGMGEKGRRGIYNTKIKTEHRTSNIEFRNVAQPRVPRGCALMAAIFHASWVLALSMGV